MNYCMVVNQNVRCFLKLSLVLVPGISQVPSGQSYVRESVVPSSRSKTIPIYSIQLYRLQVCTTESDYLPAI